MKRLSLALLGVLSSTVVFGCSSSDAAANKGGGDSGPGAGPKSRLSASALAEFHAKGVDKYVGKAVPVSHAPGTAGQEVYEFATSDGPICLWGDSYRAIVRDKQSDNLVIYLEGGGACWSTLCAANTTASKQIAAAGLLNDSATSTSPVKDWNVVYAPFCDGSVFSGDNQLPDTKSAGAMGGTRYHHGIENLTAAIDLAKSQYPNPKRILLAGSSAGGYGTLAGTGLVRLAFPDVDLIVFNDSGLGLTNPTDPTTNDLIKAEWKYDQFFPDSCIDCKTGQATALIAWGLENDPTLKAAAFSSYGDSVIAGAFLMMQPADFKALLLDKTGKVHDAYPNRFERFFIEGTQHTSLIGGSFDTTVVAGVTIADWTTAFVDGTPAWVDTLQNGGK